MTEETVEEAEAVEVETPDIPSAEQLYDGVDPVEAKEPETVEEVKEEAEPEVKAEEEAKKDDKEESVVTSAPVATPEEQIAALTKEVGGLKAAYGAEKDKRQAAEKVERPDPVDDPEGFAQSIETAASQQVGDLKHTLYTNDLLTRHEDGADVLKKFEELIVEKPWLLAEAITIHDSTGANPYQLSYDIYKRETKEPAADVDIKEMTAKITAEVEARLAKKKTVNEVKQNIPDDLSGEASKGDRKAPAFKEPTPEQLYNN